MSHRWRTPLPCYILVNRYLPRIIDAELERALASAGALVLRGPRAVGKTESARQVAASEIRLDSTEPLAVLAREQPTVALEGVIPRLLDEWQFAPGLWNAARHEVDKRQRPGQFILSGSAVPDDDDLRHSGAGRFRQLTMRTMTLFETRHSSGAVSLRELLAGHQPGTAQSSLEFADIVRRVVVGGWPGWMMLGEAEAREQAVSYLNDISAHDFVQVAGTKRDPRRLIAYLRAFAALTAHPAPLTAVSRRIRDEGSLAIGAGAAPVLHDLAERLYLVEDQEAWAPLLRSRSTAVQTPKRHLADPSLSAALLGAGSDRLLREPETLGFLFESQLVHDLRVYAQAVGAHGVFHYRDTKGRDEIDAVVEGEDGQWLAFEAKLGASSIDRAAENLLRVGQKFANPPKALIVVIPTGVSYRRPDGVLVVPLSVLGP